MKVVLVAINTKYIHSNLAVYSLKSYNEKEFGECIGIAEYTINQYTDYIINDLYKKRPDILAFSCYIWNREYVVDIIHEINKVLPDTKLWLGGPEASYNAVGMMNELDELSGVMYGEGEKVFGHMLHYWNNDNIDLSEIDGIVYRDENNKVKVNKPQAVMNMTDIPFPYNNLDDFQNKIIYYESSRGCPFSCSYCLSSIDKQLRFRDVELVKKELKFFIDNKVKQVKFVDRTFNCNKKHAMDIWKFIYEHDNGITNFHFEISADLIDDEEIELFSRFRPGLAQFEIGVQSTNEKTINEIDRKMNLTRLKEVVSRINEFENIHQHLDLIAGLPYEDYTSFANSFNDVYLMRPEQLQLGFLKVLYGSKMHDKCDEYGIVYHSTPPYEVMFTKWITFDEILELKNIEEMVEVYYNSGQFGYTMKYLERFFESPFEMYNYLADYYDENNLFEMKHSRTARFEILYNILADKNNVSKEELKCVMMFDLYLRENAKSRPAFAGKTSIHDDKIKSIYKEYRSAGNLVHVEHFQFNPVALAEKGCSHGEEMYVLFDYRERNPLNNNAKTLFGE